MDEIKAGQLVYCLQLSLQGMIYAPAYVFSTDDEYVYVSELYKLTKDGYNVSFFKTKEEAEQAIEKLQKKSKEEKSDE